MGMAMHRLIHGKKKGVKRTLPNFSAGRKDETKWKEKGGGRGEGKANAFLSVT
jgi:hypothetical protein